MMTKEILIEQFTDACDENDWFVVLKNALENLISAKLKQRKFWQFKFFDNMIWNSKSF
jgi:hypothetical protein